MEWHVRDFWSHRVRRMRPLARLMYRALLQESWHCENPGYLPPNDTELMFLADAPELGNMARVPGRGTGHV